MPEYLHPGVYIEEIPSGVKPIEGVSTSVAAFVGAASRGPAGEAVLIHSLGDYERTYGPIQSADDAMGLAVSAFFQNGGRDAYICRLVSSAPPAAKASETVGGQDTGGADVLKISASSVGAWGNELFFRVVKAAATDLTFTLEVGSQVNGAFSVDESFAGLDMNASSDNYALTRVNGSSQLVTLALEPAADPDNAAEQYQRGSLTGGQLPAAADHFSAAAGIQDGMAMNVELDGLGAKRIVLGTKASLNLTGSNVGDGGKVADAVEAAVRALAPNSEPYKSFTCDYLPTPDRQFQLTSGSDSSSSSVAVYGGDLASFLLLDPASNPTAVHGAAKVVPVDLPGAFGQGTMLAGGVEGDPAPSDYTSFFGNKLKKVQDVSIIVLPGQSVPSSGAGNGAVDAAVAHCEATGNRMVILDAEPGFELADANKVGQLALTTSTYATLYYPWVKIANPFFNADTNPNVSPTLKIAPSALAAGMWAKIDGRRGVWKAPAGLETSLLGLAGLEFDVGDSEQNQLNPLGVNALRKLPNLGTVIWGSRTLSTKADPEWRYVPVRRTAIFLGSSIHNGIQWAVFEPNDHRLWASLRLNISSFMDGLHRAGAFQGEKASDAYFVRCGLGDTMTQGDIDRGQVIVIVGFAPLKPAEFVIVRIQQKVGKQ